MGTDRTIKFEKSQTGKQTWGEFALSQSREKCHYYVYMWYVFKDGEVVPFYIGKGTGERYKIKTGRSPKFEEFVLKNECYSAILVDNLPEELAYYVEEQCKLAIKLLGYQIIDAEHDLKERKKRAKEGIAAAKARGSKFGRPSEYNGGYEEIKKRVDAGELSVTEACKEIKLSRAQWYRMASAYQ